jgi:hypothetical protein
LNHVQELVKGPASSEEILAALPGKEELVVKLVPSRGRKVIAPENARPANRFPSSIALRAYFTTVRDRTILYVRTTQDPIRQRTYDHFALGPLDGYSERHLKQLKEVLASA